MHRTTRTTAVLLFVAWAVDYIDRQVINLALPSIGDTFGLTHGERGMILSAFFVTYALTQIPAGLIAGRFGGLRVMCAALALWSLFTGLTAVAWSFAALLVFRCLFGVAQGLFPAAALEALSRRSVPEQRLTANGWVQSSNAVGGLLAAVLGGLLLAHWDWRVMFIAVSVLGLGVVVAIRRWMPAPLPAERTGPVLRRGGKSASALLRSSVIWGFAVMFFAYDTVVWGLNSWSASYLIEERGLRVSDAGLVSLAPTLCAAVAAVVGGRLSDRFEGRPRRIVVPAMSAAAVLLAVLPLTTSLGGFVVVGTLISAVIGLCYMPCFSVPLRSLPPDLAGAASGIILFGGQLSGIVVPTLFGHVVDVWSYRVAFWSLALGPVLAITAVLCLPQTSHHFLARLRAVVGDIRTKEDDSDASTAPRSA
ncbi:MFS transporter [Streptomyces sp. AC602_WCS936]|uniref:MFS transporter n=1 Tax=Streptomyces sp. AC602_WCS936 TaxID=2823685 RepID=UPI0027E53D8D|nr:MFS transporter [Streptomyces sp. AC602_WCS936]